MSRVRAELPPLAARLARAVLRRLLLVLLAAGLSYGLVLWALGWLDQLESSRVADGELLSSAALLTFGAPGLDELFRSSALLPLGAAYPLALYALVLRLPRRRRLGWWLLAWTLGVLGALMGSLALLFASLEFREMVNSGAFPLEDLIEMWWRLGREALVLSMRSGILPLGFPLALLILEQVAGRSRHMNPPPRGSAPPSSVVLHDEQTLLEPDRSGTRGGSE